MPKIERAPDGRPVGLRRGGKGRQALGGVLAIKNTWNNTHVSISNSSYKQLDFVSGGACCHSCLYRLLRTIDVAMHMSSVRRLT